MISKPPFLYCLQFRNGIVQLEFLPLSYKKVFWRETYFCVQNIVLYQLLLCILFWYWRSEGMGDDFVHIQLCCAAGVISLEFTKSALRETCFSPGNTVWFHLFLCIVFQHWRSEEMGDDCMQFHICTVQLELLPMSLQKSALRGDLFFPRKHCLVSLITLHLFSALKKRRNGWWDWSPRVAVTFWKRWNTSTNSRT